MALKDDLEVAINFNSDVLDKSGNGRNAIVNGMTYETVSPIIGSGSGTFLANDYLDLGHNYQAVFQDSFTIALWVKPDDGQPASREELFGLIDTNDRVRITLFNDGDIKVQYRLNSVNYLCTTGGSGYFLSNGQESKHLVWCEADNVTNELRIYVDNDLKFTLPGVVEPFANYGGTLSPFVGALHKASPVASRFYHGDTDALAIWSAIKSSTDRDAYWNGGDGIELVAFQAAWARNSNRIIGGGLT